MSFVAYVIQPIRYSTYTCLGMVEELEGARMGVEEV